MTTTIQNPTAHSHSRLQVFSSCPLSYRLQYIDKIPSESSDVMEIGAAAHEFFDQFVKDIRFYDSTDKYVMDLAASCFQKEARDQSNFKDYLEICRTFAREYRPDPAYPVVRCEVQFAFNRQWKSCGWLDPNVMFRVKIDRIEEPGIDESSPVGQDHLIKKIRITDYKTGYSGVIDSFQLDIYALAASLVYPYLEQIEIQFYYPRSGFKQVKLLEVKDMDITKVQLEALMERIESETKWKAKPGIRCLNCSVANHCTEKPTNLKAIDSTATAQEFGTEIAFLEAQVKAKKKALSAYCRQNGAVEAGGLVYNHYPTQSMVVDIGPFLSALVSYNVDPSTVLNPDSKAIKKAMKDVAGFTEAITPYVGYNVSTRFYGKKADDNDD